jgi:hypothetical protein
MTESRASEEKAFQTTIVKTLVLFGYVGTHIYPLRTLHGDVRTPSTSPGWPDLFYVRPPRQLAIEVKLDGVTVPIHQRAWLTLFAEIPCCRAWVIRPSKPRWDEFVEWIRRPKEAPQSFGFEPVENAAEVIKGYHKAKAARSRARNLRRGQPT